MMGSYTTKQGDMWDMIAKTETGSEYNMNDLIAANPRYVRYSVFPAGITIKIPALPSRAANTNLPPWARNR